MPEGMIDTIHALETVWAFILVVGTINVLETVVTFVGGEISLLRKRVEELEKTTIKKQSP